MIIICLYVLVFAIMSVTNDKVIIFPQQDGSKKIIDILKTAKKSIKFIIYRLNLPSITEEVIKLKKEKNIEIQFIMNHFYIKESDFKLDALNEENTKKLRFNKKTYNKLVNNGIKVKIKQNTEFFAYHPKIIIIDNEKALISTVIFNHKSFTRSKNLCIITEKKDIIKLLNRVFEHDYNDKPLNSIYNENLCVTPINYEK
mgnify:CR=1 FL=1